MSNLTRQIPNALTILRIFLSPFLFYYLSRGRLSTAFLLVLFVFLTDFFDGFLSRVLESETNFGKIMDPFADRLAVVCVVGGLAFGNRIPFEVLLVILLREILAIGGYVAIKTFLSKDFKIIKEGKVVAALVYIVLTLSILFKLPSWFFYLLAFIYFIPFAFYLKQAVALRKGA
ncbi:MAG: CDP-alcohol phosphatidyltransferase family protein [Actinobacteria bacterium]|nr:CDP-alcohol phosphatidyltransferase family protein [Actinomycetota bacterium]